MKFIIPRYNQFERRVIASRDIKCVQNQLPSLLVKSNFGDEKNDFVQVVLRSVKGFDRPSPGTDDGNSRRRDPIMTNEIILEVLSRGEDVVNLMKCPSVARFNVSVKSIRVDMPICCVISPTVPGRVNKQIVRSITVVIHQRQVQGRDMQNDTCAGR